MFPVKVFALHASVYTGSGVGVHMTSLCICVCRTQEQVETQWEPKETKEMWEYLENQEHPVRPQKKNDPSDDTRSPDTKIQTTTKDCRNMYHWCCVVFFLAPGFPDGIVVSLHWHYEQWFVSVTDFGPVMLHVRLFGNTLPSLLCGSLSGW